MYVTKVVDTLRVWVFERCLQSYTCTDMRLYGHDVIQMTPGGELCVEINGALVVVVAQGKVVNTLPRRLGRYTCFGPRHVFAVDETAMLVKFGPRGVG